MTTPEAKARQNIDALLAAAGWHVCNVAQANIHAGDGTVKGVAIREFPLNPGFGFADYLLYVNGKACGVIEAEEEGTTPSPETAQVRVIAEFNRHLSINRDAEVNTYIRCAQAREKRHIKSRYPRARKGKEMKLNVPTINSVEKHWSHS